MSVNYDAVGNCLTKDDGSDVTTRIGCHCWLAQQCRVIIDGMTSKHRKRVKHYDEPGHCHELTFSCYRQLPLLTNDPWRILFCQSVDRAVKRHHYRLYAFVLMPEHVHLLVQPLRDGSPVFSLLKAIKRPFSYRIKQRLIESKSPLLNKLTIRQRPGVTTFRF